MNNHIKEVLKERLKSKELQVETITEKIREIGEIVELKIANVQITAWIVELKNACEKAFSGWK